MAQQYTTEENVKNCVRKIALKEGFKNATITVKPFTEGTNYLGDLYYVDVEEEGKDDLHLFAKAANTQRDLPVNLIYQHEVFVYTGLFEIFKDLQDQYSIPEEKRFKFPKFYGSNLNKMKEVIVLENLVAKEYTLHDRFKPISWEYAKKALEEITKFHAFSFALKEHDINKFNGVVSMLKNNYNSETFKKLIYAAKTFVPSNVKLIEEKNRNMVQKFVDSIEEKIMIDQFKPNCKYPIIIHADYRPSNIMINKKVNYSHLIPVDYQLVTLGNPLNDIIYLLFTGTDESFRRQYFEKYLSFYYDNLRDNLKLFSVDIQSVYPKFEYYFEMKEKLIYGLEIALTTLNAELNQGTTNSLNKFMNIYEERLNGIVNDYIRLGLLAKFERPLSSDKKEVKSVKIKNVENIGKEIASQQGFKNFILKTKMISTEGANYTSDLFCIDITEKDKNALNLFVKAANTPENIRTFLPIEQIFKHEVYVYTVISDVFNDIQEKHGVPKEKRFEFSKYYGCSFTDKEEAIVFENLSRKGYILYDRFKPFDWKYAKAALEELAKFHAISFTYKLEYPEKFGEVIKTFPAYIELLSDALARFGQSITSKLPFLTEKVNPEYKNKLIKYTNSFSNTFISKVFKETSQYSCIIHTDYRASNIMVKYKDDKVTSLIPVDYQNATYGCPVYDILYLLFTGSDANFRKHYMDKFFEHYYSCFADFLKLLSQDVNTVWPKSAFYFDLKERILYGIDVGISILPMVLTEETDTAETLESVIFPDKVDDEKSFAINEIYVERLNGIVEDYVKWGFLKDE